MSCVGLVLVSHSEKLVEGLAEFLSQIQKGVPVAIAGGTDDGELGTSPFKIKEAIERVYSDCGVLVLFDIGSAAMSVEMAIEMLGDEKKIRVADAPLVEGAYAAAVEAGSAQASAPHARAVVRAHAPPVEERWPTVKPAVAGVAISTKARDEERAIAEDGEEEEGKNEGAGPGVHQSDSSIFMLP